MRTPASLYDQNSTNNLNAAGMNGMNGIQYGEYTVIQVDY